MSDSPAWSDFLTLQACLSAAGWFTTSAFALHGLHLSGSKVAALRVWGALAIGIGLFTIYNGAVEHRDARESAATLSSIDTTVKGIARDQMVPGTPSAREALDAINGKLQDQAAQIKKMSEDRAIPPEIAADLTERLRQIGPNDVTISVALTDREQSRLASQLIQIFTSAGWKPKRMPGPFLLDIPSPPFGITIVTSKGDLRAAVIVEQELVRSGLTFSRHIYPVDGVPAGSLLLAVLPKP